jgi:catechol 2,3-dioxygenase-like lactoylglutathione lyase family enzyme
MFQPRTLIQLGVEDLPRSAAFYEALLNAKPAHASAAAVVFDIDAPPLSLTLQARDMGRRAGRKRPPPRRFEIVVPEPEQVGAAAVALRRAGARLRFLDRRIEATDPDGNVWRVLFEPRAAARSVSAGFDEEGAA